MATACFEQCPSRRPSAGAHGLTGVCGGIFETEDAARTAAGVLEEKARRAAAAGGGGGA
jgi:hypothetical protein